MKQVTLILLISLICLSYSSGQFIGTVKDVVNGQVYKTVQIGNQLWLAENLKNTKFSDGTEITLIDNPTKWASSTTPAYCWYNEDIKNRDKYGALYNFYAVADKRNICPDGWHVPSGQEWNALRNYLGRFYNLGSDDPVRPAITKSMASKTGWNAKDWRGNNSYLGYDPESNNKSGFSALPGGWLASGKFSTIGERGYWWTSTEVDNSQAWWRAIFAEGATIYLDYPRSKKFGMSVRCLRDY